MMYLVAAAFVLVQLAIPLLRRWWAVPQRLDSGPAPGGLAATTASLLLAPLLGGAGGGLLCGMLLSPCEAFAQPASMVSTNSEKQPILAESVTQQIRVQEDFVFGTAKIRWNAVKGQTLPLLHAGSPQWRTLSVKFALSM
jgi:hypothetical protein